MVDVFGFLSNNIDELSTMLEEIMGITFELHDSLFYGGDYYYYSADDFGGVELILQNNAELEDELAEPDHPEMKVIFHSSWKDKELMQKTRNRILNLFGDNVRLLRNGK